MLFFFTVGVLAIYFLAAFGLILLCEHVLRYPQKDSDIQGMISERDSKDYPDSFDA